MKMNMMQMMMTPVSAAGGASSSPWDMTELSATLTPSPVGGGPAAARSVPPASKSPHSFLGENSGLVNLDNLIGAPAGAAPPSAVQQGKGGGGQGCPEGVTLRVGCELATGLGVGVVSEAAKCGLSYTSHCEGVENGKSMCVWSLFK